MRTASPRRRRGDGPVHPEVNVTPLVDVVLVLLIIFMVLAPILSAEFLAKLPKPADPTQQALAAATADQPVVVVVDAQAVIRVNGVEIPEDDLAVRLDRILNARPNRLVYVDAADDAPHGLLLSTMERVYAGRAAPVVVVTEPVAVVTP